MVIVEAADARRFKLDARYAVGLRTVLYNRMRSVVGALHAELRGDCKAGTVGHVLKKGRKRHLRRRLSDKH